MNWGKIAVTGFVLCMVCVGWVSAGQIASIDSAVETEFGTYEPVTVSVTPSVSPCEYGENLSNVTNIGDFSLDDKARGLLETNGFAATAGGVRQVYDIYNACRDRDIPIFVTTDACLHTYHIMYDYVLRVLEIEHFIDDLNTLTSYLILDMNEAYNEATEPSVKEAALDNIAYLSVARKLLDPTAAVDERVEDVVGEELSLIMGLSAGYVPSPLFYSTDYPYEEDYSQYKPRGHYTRSEDFERFFRAMMWYGRMTYSVNMMGTSDEGYRWAALRAMLMSRAVDRAASPTDDLNYVTAVELWRRIYEPTVFFVGKADDINYDAYIELGLNIFGRSFTRLSADLLADTAKLDALIADVRELPDPKITVKAGKGFRLMGQRFIPDSYMLDQLVDELVPLRLMPRGLDVMAVLGSDRAYEIIDTFYHDPDIYEKYDPQIAALREEFSGYKGNVWAQNLYFNWLYTLTPLLDVKGEGYPLFMQNTAWVDKSLDTALGSWAELRHDTILYAKQSETRETSAPPDPELIRGYVEPEPEVYARLAALASFTRRGLAERELSDDLFDSRLADFESLMLSLMTIAVKELENRTPYDEEYALICNFGETITNLTTFPPEFSDRYENDADDYMAVIADVHTDPNTNTCLEVGVGHPLEIYVIAPVNGVPTLTKGGIFAYHEFTQDLADGRLTDEEWQAMQSSAEAVAMPEWTESFVAGPSSSGENVFHFYPSSGRVVSVDDGEKEPAAFPLLTCSPNPFNPSTMIGFTLLESSRVRLDVYNLSGQRVAVILDEWRQAGAYNVRWTPEGLASGIYLVRIESAGKSNAVKVTFMK